MSRSYFVLLCAADRQLLSMVPSWRRLLLLYPHASKWRGRDDGAWRDGDEDLHFVNADVCDWASSSLAAT